MRTSRISKILVLSAVFLLCCSVTAFAAFTSGTGTEDDPYIVTTAEQLDAIRNQRVHYKLGNDIDLTEYLTPGGAGYVKWGTSGWDPIEWNQYLGNRGFDGDWHKITGLWINRGTENGVGLFGAILNTTIENLGIEIDNALGGVKGQNSVGGLVGLEDDISGDSITNCYVIGNVSGNNNVGGLVGYASGGLSDSSIVNSYVTGEVRGNDKVGGLVGLLYNSFIIADCYATANVVGNDRVGGLAGQLELSSTTIDACYSTGNVCGNSNVGGIVGMRNSGAAIRNSYRYQLVSVNSEIRVDNDPSSIHGGIVTASQLKRQATYTTLTNWTFSPLAWHWSGDLANGFPKLNIGDEEYPFPFPATANPETFTVTFNSQGGTAVSPVIDVPSGTLIARPTDPTRTGYTLTGWYRDSAATQPWNFNTNTVTDNITLYAGWQLEAISGTFTVTFDSQGGSYVAPVSGLVYGATIVRPAEPTRGGYTFTGWYRDSAATQPWNFNNNNVTGNITLYAGWWRNNSSDEEDESGGCSAIPTPMLIIFAVFPLFFSRRKK